MFEFLVLYEMFVGSRMEVFYGLIGDRKLVYLKEYDVGCMFSISLKRERSYV